MGAFMRNKYLLVPLIILIFVSTSCANNTSTNNQDRDLSIKPSETNNVTNSSKDVVNEDNSSYKQIETDLYLISIPSDFSYSYENEDPRTDTLIFKKDNKVIGGTIPYDCYTGEYSSILPPYAKAESSQKLTGFLNDTVWYVNVEVPPKGSFEVSTNSIKQTHIYYIFEETHSAFDLFFNTEDIDEKLILNIAKTFKNK